MASRTQSFVADFEYCVERYVGCRYAVAVSSFSMAVFLAFKAHFRDKTSRPKKFLVPRHCDLRTLFAIRHAVPGPRLEFMDIEWKGEFRIDDVPIVDSSCRFAPGMCQMDEMRCVDFGPGSHVPIGGGGMVLTSCSTNAAWIRRASQMGVSGSLSPDNPPGFLGWDSTFRPADAVAGITMLESLPWGAIDIQRSYPDASAFKVLQLEYPSGQEPVRSRRAVRARHHRQRMRRAGTSGPESEVE